MGEKFQFSIPKKSKTTEKDPESIFRELQIPTVKGLWSQQADILRSYYGEFKDKRDVAIELPTGTGKTLVGLLIAEYRRRCKEERVVYLCPTKQLANQVYIKAKEYGIPACLLIGQQKFYPEDAYGDYVLGKSIAITTYSAIFNTYPRLNDSNIIIFDDAHSAENYISSLWTVSVKRSENKEVFESIIELFKEDISEYEYNRIMNEDFEFYKPIYDLVPYPKYYEKLPDLISILESNVRSCGNAKYPWSKISNNLEACQLFFSWGEINIRPILPPTLTHDAFSNANQRIYMSATLGESGELERISGVKKISKIPIPKGWDKYSNGRRLILFPDRKFNSEESLSLIFKAIQQQERALVLCPDYKTAEFFGEKLIEVLPQHSIVHANEIEESLEPFLEKKNAVLILTNRYDGIDLSGEICRLLIIYGMPKATNLQEGFLWNRLNANAVLNELVKTRITQALGRCTRSSDDFTNVIMSGSDLLRFCAKKENLAGFHPEIQAEFDFGLTNSENFESVEQMSQFMNDFITDRDYFSEINEAISQLRDEYEKITKTEAKSLITSVTSEVEFNYALWKNELDHALEKVKNVLDSLSGGKELDGYRAWWFYIAGNLAYLANKKISSDERLYRQYYSSALRISYSMTWLADLIHHLPTEGELTKIDPILATQAENLETKVTELGFQGVKFEKKMKEFLELINENEAGKFEKGLELLGEYLGFESQKFKGDGMPDGTWFIRDIVYGFEAKTEEKENAPISIDTCRQANGHKNTIKEKLKLNDISGIDVIVISNKGRLHKDAAPQARELFHLDAEGIRILALKCTQVLRKIRSTIVSDNGNTLFTKEQIKSIIEEENLTYRNINEILKGTKMDAL
jgi:Rad3-related DNA helicase